MRMRFLCASALVSIGISAGAAPADFERDVAPLLSRQCLGCHNAQERKGGLDLSCREGLVAGGERGAAIVPGKVEESRLVARLRRREMPPARRGAPPPPTEAEIDTLAAWIAGGAAWPAGRRVSQYEVTSSERAGADWWSLRPIRRRAPPALHDAGGTRTPIDAFLRARLEREELSPAPEADRRTLMRRLSFDLHGLPPEPDAVARFAGDPAPDAYERLVDELLASPRFGERWGRYWLDLVRYADTNGYERDAAKPGAWRYRDYVIAAMNADKPFDRFIAEQLAGDELPERSEETLIATGLLRLGTWDDEPNDPLDYQYERLEDLVHVTTSAFLGLTVKCARCHDHKFDPVPQTDYYRLAAAFWPGPIGPRGRELLGGPSKEELGVDVLGWTDLSASAQPLARLHKGDPRQPREEVPPGALSFVAPPLPVLAAPPQGTATTTRRLQLARWIAHPSHPLTARVIANRLWQHHFGVGLVASSANFGFKGDPPTHPELLDALARELIDQGWTLKRLHREILLSSAYRMASIHPAPAGAELRDAGDRLLWRAARRRLDAEALRDSLLWASGELQLKMGGEGFVPRLEPDALEGLSRKGGAWAESSEPERCRRAVYLFSKRSLISPLMTVFDFADTTQPCERRDVTVVAPQALALLNNAFVHERGAALARRLAAEAPADETARIRRAFQLLFARPPAEAELAAAEKHLAAQEAHYLALAGAAAAAEPPRKLAWDSLCLVLLNANEFIYVD